MKKRISYCAVLGLAVAAFGFNAEAKDAKDLASSFALSAGAYYKTVTVSQRYDVKSDLTVPARVSLKFENGGALKLAKDATLTINGSIEAPMQQIFDGSVVFGPGRVSKVYPQWWGAMGDGTHDDTAAIQSAIDSLSRGGTVFFPPGEYANKGVTTASKVRFKGAGVDSSAMKFTPKDGACIKLPVDCASFRLEDMSLVTSGESLAYGIDGTNEYVRYFSMRNFSVTGFKTGIYIQQGMHITLDYGYRMLRPGEGQRDGGH